MVESCSAINCTSRRTKKLKLKFHRFPKDIHLHRLWVNATRRVNFMPSNTAVICEKHFTTEDYEVNVHGNRVLKKGAVPSVFDFPSHLKKEIKKRRVLKRRIKTVSPITKPATKDHAELPMDIENKENLEVMNISDSLNIPDLSACKDDDPQPSTSRETAEKLSMSTQRQEPYFFGDFKESDLKHAERRRRFWQVANKTVARYRKLNKYYSCKIRRQKQKIKNLNSLLDVLMKKEKISAMQSLVLKESIPETQKQQKKF